MAKSLFILHFILFFFWTYYIREKYGKVSHVMSHDECGKMVHRPYSSYISSIPKINEDSIEFFLST